MSVPLSPQTAPMPINNTWENRYQENKAHWDRGEISPNLLKGTSINCLRPLRDLNYVAARREPKQNGYSILKAQNAADAWFRSRPAGLYTRFRLRVTLF